MIKIDMKESIAIRKWSDGSYGGCTLLEAEDGKSLKWTDTCRVEVDRIPNPDQIPLMMALSSVGKHDLPTIDFLASALNKCRPTIIKWLKELEELELIQRYRCVCRNGSGKHAFRVVGHKLRFRRLKTKFPTHSPKETKSFVSERLGGENKAETDQVSSPPSSVSEKKEEDEKVLLPRNTQKRATARCSNELKEPFTRLLACSSDQHDNSQVRRRFCHHWDVRNITMTKIAHFEYLLGVGKAHRLPMYELIIKFKYQFDDPERKAELRLYLRHLIEQHGSEIPELVERGISRANDKPAEYDYAYNYLERLPDVESLQRLINPIRPSEEPPGPVCIINVLFDLNQIHLLYELSDEVIQRWLKSIPCEDADPQSYKERALKILEETAPEVCRLRGQSSFVHFRDYVRSTSTTGVLHARKMLENAWARLGLDFNYVVNKFRQEPHLADSLDIYAPEKTFFPHLA